MQRRQEGARARRPGATATHLDQDPEGLHVAVHGGVPGKVGRNGQHHLQRGARNGLHVGAELHARQQMNVLVQRLAELEKGREEES